MRIDQKHIPWAIFVTAATLFFGALFLAEFHPQYLPFHLSLPKFLSEAPRERNSYGASPLGLLFGILALAIFVFASALGVRKKKRLWRIGSVQSWLRAHIWLTTLTIPLVLLHCGGHAGGPMTTTVVILYAFVMVSGFFGIAMQGVLPRMMKDSLSREVVYEQIPHVRKRIMEAALEFRGDLFEKIGSPKIAASEEAGAVAVEADPSEHVLVEFMDEECLPYLHSSRGAAKGMRLSDKKSSDDVFRLLRLNVSDNFRGKADEIQLWCDDRRLMDLQVRMHHWMHGWLLIHVPVSFALLVFTFWHAYVTWKLL